MVSEIVVNEIVFNETANDDSADLKVKDEQRPVDSVNQFLVTARRLMGPDVTALRLHILLTVYQNEGCNQRTLLQNLDMTSVTALSRNLADMSALTSTKKPGPNLIELRFDVMNLRSKTVHLTPSGRAVVEQLLSA